MNVFELMAKIGLDSTDYERGLNDSESKLEQFGSKVVGGVGTVAKLTAGAVAAGSVAVGKLVGDSVSAYSEYEQNLGGIKKLYGNMGQSLEEYAASTGRSVEEVQLEWHRLQYAQDLVLENAKNAYKTAGMDANTYMTTATSFSASLINSLNGDTARAAEQTDVAMRAISDNWNTFGGDIQNIQNAYQGFAKQNYTMLDNLKLGYGGTKGEMERLILDAEKVSDTFEAQRDESGKLVMGFSDIVTAIDLIQQKQGIAGTTQREAATTIAGSLNMTKAAWQNLVIGLTDSEADINQLVDNLINAIVGENEGEGLINNILPAIERALAGVVTLFERIAPVISEHLPGLVEQILPPLIEAAASLVAGIVQALPTLIQVLIEQIPMVISILFNALMETLPQFIEAGQGLVQGMGEGMELNIPAIILSIRNVLLGLIDTVMDFLPQLLQRGSDFVTNISEGIIQNAPRVISAIATIITNLINRVLAFLPQFQQNGADFILNMTNGIMQIMPSIITTIGNLVSNLLYKIFEYLPQFLETGANFIVNMIQGIAENLPAILQRMAEVINNLISIIMENLPEFLSKGVEIIGKVASGIGDALPTIITSMAELLASVIANIVEHLPEFLQKGIELVGEIAKGLIEAIPDIVSKIPEIIAGIVDAFMGYDWLGMGMNIIYGIGDGFTNAGGWLWDKAVSTVSDAWNGMLDWLGIASPSKKARDVIGKNWAEGIGIGFAENMPVDEMTGSLENAFNELNDVQPDISTDYNINSGRSYGGAFAPVLNIYGADGQNVNELADVIMERLAFLYNQEGAAYGFA